MICGWIGVVRESFEDFEHEVLILLMGQNPANHQG